MDRLSLFEIAVIAFGFVAVWLLSLTLYARRSARARRISLTLLGCSLISLAIIYLVLAGMLFFNTGYLYYANRGNVVAATPDGSWLSLALTVFVAALPPLLLLIIGYLVLKNARVGPNNSFKPMPLRGTA